MTVREFPEPLPADELRRRCDPASLPFETTEDVQAVEEIIGQDRAVRAIRLGLDLPSEGYNIFVVGHSGTGRNTTINRFLEQVPRDGPAPPDLVYVNNFKEPDRPRLLIFPPGAEGSSAARSIPSSSGSGSTFRPSSNPMSTTASERRSWKGTANGSGSS